MSLRTLHLTSASLLILLIVACEEMVWDNPGDPNADIDPEDWKPVNLQAQVLDDSRIRLTWEQEETRIAGFRIERSTGGNFAQIAEVGADVTEYTDTGLNYGTDYTYRVKAFTDENESGYSNTVTIGNVTVSDIDGNVYQTIKIGNQIWMAENLKVSHYRNGDAIPNVTDDTDWSNLTTGAYSEYDNNSANVDTYGRLYNWYAVDDSRNIAPAGWHVPTDNEWQTLVDYLGGNSVAGGKMKETGTEHWNSPNTGATNESGFTALPGGNHDYDSGNYIEMGDYAYFWSATDGDSNFAWTRLLHYQYSIVIRSYGYKRGGWSVRCVRD